MKWVPVGQLKNTKHESAEMVRKKMAPRRGDEVGARGATEEHEARECGDGAIEDGAPKG